MVEPLPPALVTRAGSCRPGGQLKVPHSNCTEILKSIIMQVFPETKLGAKYLKTPVENMRNKVCSVASTNNNIKKQ